jgi:tetratricopeptide (TPR) repeat protein
MNARSIPFGLMLLPLFCAISVPAQTAKPAAPASAPAQTAKPATPATAPAPARPHPADAAARKQLAAYMADFQNSPQDATLRDKIVALAKTLKPPPAVPQLAQDNFAKASAQMTTASSADEFKAVARQFEEVALLAPWFAEADLSAASAYAKAADYDGAKRNLALYMAAVRSGVDTQNAQELGRSLDRQKAEGRFEQALQQYRANPSDAARLQIIKAAQTMQSPPDIPEDARGHFVMAVVLVNTAEDNSGYEHAIEQFKAAAQGAPWWGDAYKKLAEAEKAVGRYNDAIASLNLYEIAQPTDARSTQDEIYSLTVLAQREADDKAKKQAAEEQRKLVEDQKEKERADREARRYTIEGRWFETPSPGDLFIGGKSNPECDYSISQSGGKWAVTNTCSRPPWTIDKIQVQPGQISFRLTGNDPGYPVSVAIVTFRLSNDGETLNGQESIFNSGQAHLSDHAVRWVRRE